MVIRQYVFGFLPFHVFSWVNFESAVYHMDNGLTHREKKLLDIFGKACVVFLPFDEQILATVFYGQYTE